jgi:hypothetical protein
MSADSAREELVYRLNHDYPNVKYASLSSDGYTIGINFTDGQTCLINTYEDF